MNRKPIGIVLIIAAAALLLTATSCGPDGESGQYTIGITKIVAHPALDALEQGIIEVVSAEYPDARFDLQNANGDLSTAATIAQKFKTDKVDLAVGIATPTAQALANVLTDIPVVFSAVTDPVDAGLITTTAKGQGNITGVSDMTPVRDQIALLADLMEVETLGHIYTSNEANAVRLADIAREACAEMGINFVETTVTNSAEVKQAAQAIADRVDAFYVTTDNTVVSALAAIIDVAEKEGLPILSADPSSAMDGGVFLASGFDYYKMGLASGEMILEILAGADPDGIPTRYMDPVDDGDLLVDLSVAGRLGIEVPASIRDAASTVIE